MFDFLKTKQTEGGGVKVAWGDGVEVRRHAEKYSCGCWLLLLPRQTQSSPKTTGHAEENSLYAPRLNYWVRLEKM